MTRGAVSSTDIVRHLLDFDVELTVSMRSGQLGIMEFELCKGRESRSALLSDDLEISAALTAAVKGTVPCC